MLIFSKKQHLDLLILYIVFFVFIFWFLLWSFINSCHQVGLCFVYPCFFKFWSYITKSFVMLFLNFHCRHLKGINFPCRTAFSVSQRFWYVVFSFSFSSRKYFISSLTHPSWMDVLLNLHEFVFIRDLFALDFKFYCIIVR